ncbi:MAG: hypothetical protein KGI97_06510 [Alphaproteobacteria bacterium]|nr:hypothetical protein [Alphaproteobacteria bacterium]
MKNTDKASVTKTVIAANLEGLTQRLTEMAQLAKEASAAMEQDEQNLAIGTVLGFESQIPEIEALFKTTLLMHRGSV